MNVPLQLFPCRGARTRRAFPRTGRPLARTLRLLCGARRNRRPVPSRRPRHRKGAYQGFRPPEYMNSPRPSAVVVTFQLFTVRRYIACGTPRRTLTAKIHLGRGMWHGALPRRTGGLELLQWDVPATDGTGAPQMRCRCRWRRGMSPDSGLLIGCPAPSAVRVSRVVDTGGTGVTRSGRCRARCEREMQ